MKMGYSSYFMGLFNFIKRYPETLLALSCFVFFRLWLQYRKRKIPINWPIFGMVPSLLLNIHRLHDWCSDALKTSGSTFVFKGPWFVGMEILFTCDPDNVNHITKANFLNYPKGADFLEIFDILGTGILASDSDLWKIQRKMTQIFVHNSKFRQFSTVTGREKVEKGLIPIFQDAVEYETVLDLQDVLQRFTFDATCILLFGIDPGNLTVGLPNFVFPHAIHELEEACFYRYIVPKFVWKTLRWLNVGEERKLAKSWVIIDEFLHNCIANRREALAKAKMGKEEGSGDLLTSFMDYPLEDESSVTKTEKFLRDTAVNMLVAGKDTTFSALIWFFWLLSKNPAVEAKLLDELLKHFPEMASNNTPELFDTDRLAELPYLHAALSESLRLYPPGHIVHRGVAETEILPNGTEVRPGMQVMYNIYAMGRMETLWGPDCLEFKPERWISEKGTLKYISPYKFMSFNSGPRSCLGKEVAYTLLKAAVAPLLFYFKIQVVEGQGDVRPSISVTLPVKNGLMVKVKKRDLTQHA